MSSAEYARRLRSLVDRWYAETMRVLTGDDVVLLVMVYSVRAAALGVVAAAERKDQPDIYIKWYSICIAALKTRDLISADALTDALVALLERSKRTA